jgi:hypothetical protein
MHTAPSSNNNVLASGKVLDSELNATQQTTITAVWSCCKEFFKFAQFVIISGSLYYNKQHYCTTYMIIFYNEEILCSEENYFNICG